MMKNKYFKYIFVFIFTIAAALLIKKNGHELRGMVEAFTTGKVSWLIAALATELVVLWSFIKMHIYSFKSTGATTDKKRVGTLVISAMAVNAMAPTADTAAYLLYASDAKKHNEPQTKVVAGVILSTIIDYASFSVILLVAGGFLIHLKEFTLYELISSIIFMALTLLMAGLIYLGIKSPHKLGKIIHYFSSKFNSLTKKMKKSFTVSHDFERVIVNEIEEIAISVKTHTKSVLSASLYSVCFHLSNVLIILLLFYGFDTPMKISYIVAAYAVSFLFKIVSPVPQGIGIVEGALTLVFTSLGVPLAIAATIAVMYRFITFWVPFAISFLTLQHYNLTNY